MPEKILTPDGEPHSHLPLVLPDPSICRTEAIGEIKGFATCLVNRPNLCRFAMGYGDSFLCRHPNWKNFLHP
jgi:hypothetical protein